MVTKKKMEQEIIINHQSADSSFLSYFKNYNINTLTSTEFI